MRIHLSLVGILALGVSAIAARPPLTGRRNTSTIATPCAADSSYQRLSFWVGTWEVFDSTGARYATQRVNTVLDACAIVAEWNGSRGDKGISLSAFDPKTREWKQVYTSNQVPALSSVSIRKSDSSYAGPGMRFVPLVDPASDTVMRTRVTILPLDGHRAMQLFEDSRDGGKTWHLAFKAEHRLQQSAGH